MLTDGPIGGTNGAAGLAVSSTTGANPMIIAEPILTGIPATRVGRVGAVPLPVEKLQTAE
ncbi:hypothetical protein ANOBCDAF_02466 [Pleomorphomonas sp. T1.2MG-36]|nr:hypothetical protein ANOBCDAF_02466 [Pleomorphomonas sp. T1.2MG-36]